MNVEAVLLGVAQDGGVPQAGCDCANCRRAWDEPAFRQPVVCLGLVDRLARQTWLIDATPDFREQVQVLRRLAPDCRLAGIVLTHAHVGHYTGLVHLGREVMDARDVPLYVTSRMACFLRENAPWSQLIALHNVELCLLDPGSPIQLSPALSLLPLAVPHRGEFSDTLACVVRGGTRQLFYCPDIDAWDGWEHDVREFVGQMDVALLDGTFFNADELPNRDLSEIPHPFVVDTVRRVAGVDCDVRLVHLNHTNPLLSPGPERDWLLAQGIGVGTCGERWTLG